MTAARYVVKPDVISETARPMPRVIDWPFSQKTVIACHGLPAGARLDRLARGKRRGFLDAWLARLLALEIEIVPFGREVARAVARIESAARRCGRFIDAHDLFILASATTGVKALATRNVTHFRGREVPIF